MKWSNFLHGSSAYHQLESLHGETPCWDVELLILYMIELFLFFLSFCSCEFDTSMDIFFLLSFHLSVVREFVCVFSLRWWWWRTVLPSSTCSICHVWSSILRLSASSSLATCRGKQCRFVASFPWMGKAAKKDFKEWNREGWNSSSHRTSLVCFVPNAEANETKIWLKPLMIKWCSNRSWQLYPTDLHHPEFQAQP